MWAALPAIPVTVVIPMIAPVAIAMIVVMVMVSIAIRSTISAVVPTSSVIAMIRRNDAPAKRRHGGDEKHKIGLHVALLFSRFPFRAYALGYQLDVGTKTFRTKAFSYSEGRRGAKQ